MDPIQGLLGSRSSAVGSGEEEGELAAGGAATSEHEEDHPADQLRKSELRRALFQPPGAGAGAGAGTPGGDGGKMSPEGNVAKSFESCTLLVKVHPPAHPDRVDGRAGPAAHGQGAPRTTGT